MRAARICAVLRMRNVAVLRTISVGVYGRLTRTSGGPIGGTKAPQHSRLVARHVRRLFFWGTTRSRKDLCRRPPLRTHCTVILAETLFRVFHGQRTLPGRDLVSRAALLVGILISISLLSGVAAHAQKAEPPQYADEDACGMCHQDEAEAQSGGSSRCDSVQTLHHDARP